MLLPRCLFDIRPNNAAIFQIEDKPIPSLKPTCSLFIYLSQGRNG